jgi:hypothetical protein
MDFYVIFSVVALLLTHNKWKMHRCRREADNELRYFVTSANNRVLTPTKMHRRTGLTLQELLLWLEEYGDSTLAEGVRSFRSQVAASPC